MANYKFYAVYGAGRTEISADEIELHLSDGQRFSLGINNDGEVVISSYNNRLVIVPMASNCCRIYDAEYTKND